MSWLNTNTVQGRFDLIARLQILKYSQLLRRRDRTTSTPTRRATPRACVRRARTTSREPPVAVAATTAAIVSYATADAAAAQTTSGEHHGAAARFYALQAHDARRPRRTGDVTCAASNAKRSSSPASATSGRGRRCRSRTPRSTASRPAAAPSDLTRPRLLQWGVAGFASVYGAQELGFEEVWESVAEAAEAPPDKRLVLLYLAGGNDGLNVVAAQRRRRHARAGQLHRLRRRAPGHQARGRGDAAGRPVGS